LNYEIMLITFKMKESTAKIFSIESIYLPEESKPFVTIIMGI
jgi:hypothetical protein